MVLPIKGKVPIQDIKKIKVCHKKKNMTLETAQAMVNLKNYCNLNFSNFNHILKKKN